MSLNGNAPQLRRKATKIPLCNGAIDVWYLPDTPMIESVAMRNMWRILGDNPADAFHSQFVTTDCSIVDFELIDDSNEDARTLADYIGMRGDVGSMDNFKLFAVMFTADFVNDELWTKGYEPTRRQLPEAPKATRKPKPAKDSPLGKSGKKRTEPTT